MQVTNVYLVDMGVLIKEGEDEFESYNSVYDKKYGYYDDNQYYSNDNLEKIKTLCREWLEDCKDGNPYAIISLTQISDYVVDALYKEGGDLDDLPVEDESYDVGSIVYSIARIDDKIVEDFIK